LIKVNMASRMESSGEPGRIQMSSQLHDLILSRADPFLMEERGQINVKVNWVLNLDILIGLFT
jgi:class 3 adenylate cyclase